MLLVMWWGVLPFKILMSVIAGVATWELHRIMTHAGNRDFFALTLTIAGAFWLAEYLSGSLLISFAAVLMLVTLMMILFAKTRLQTRWMSTLFCGVYVSFGLLMLVHIRGLGIEKEGFWYALTVLLMIWGNDIFAYFGGKSFGKHPLAPMSSPKKTWEGFGFGFIGSAAGFLVVYFVAAPFPGGLISIVPMTLLVSTLGPAGDITESSLKRRAGVKDSSSILPGHGGLLDRFDSLILVTPFLYFFFFFWG